MIFFEYQYLDISPFDIHFICYDGIITDFNLYLNDLLYGQMQKPLYQILLETLGEQGTDGMGKSTGNKKVEGMMTSVKENLWCDTEVGGLARY